MKWTKQEETILRKLREEGRTNKEISDFMGKSVNSIDCKIGALKLPGSTNVSGVIAKTAKDKAELIVSAGKALVEIVQNHAFKIPDIERLIKDDKNKKEEISVLDMSDIHVGVVNKIYDTVERKQVETYNFEIFKQELSRLKQSIFEIYGLLSNAYTLKKLHINFLGDMVTNDRIFDGQRFEIDRCVGKQMWDSVGYLVEFINSMKQLYETIEVTCVVGNHGRSTPDYEEEPVENNFEYHLYKVIQQAFKDDKRVTITVPDTRTHVVEIGKWRHLIMHGDMFSGSGGNMETKIEKLYVNVGEFDFIDMGHFHNLHEDNISDKITVKYNGGWVEKEAYAYKKFRKYSIPKQWFYGCNDTRPETWSFKLDLRKPKES